MINTKKYSTFFSLALQFIAKGMLCNENHILNSSRVGKSEVQYLLIEFVSFSQASLNIYAYFCIAFSK